MKTTRTTVLATWLRTGTDGYEVQLCVRYGMLWSRALLRSNTGPNAVQRRRLSSAPIL